MWNVGLRKIGRTGAGTVGRVLVYRMDHLAREALLAEQLYR